VCRSISYESITEVLSTEYVQINICSFLFHFDPDFDPKKKKLEKNSHEMWKTIDIHNHQHFISFRKSSTSLLVVVCVVFRKSTSFPDSCFSINAILVDFVQFFKVATAWTKSRLIFSAHCRSFSIQFSAAKVNLSKELKEPKIPLKSHQRHTFDRH
jgi:hypothetical protein